MPVSSRKMVASTNQPPDVRFNDTGDIATRGCKEERENEGSNGVSEIKTSSTGAASSNSGARKCSSVLQPVSDNATKAVKVEPSESPPLVTAHGNRENTHNPSVSASTRYSSRQTPLCSSPSQAAGSSRPNNLFSPQPQTSKLSHHRADYDTLDLDDTMMGEAPFQFEEGSPQSESLEAEAGQESASKSSSRKRGSSRSDFPHPPKRSQTMYPHHTHYSHVQEDPSGSAASHSKSRSSNYYGYYGHQYSIPTYHGESRTPNRGNHPQGGYYPGYSPYHGMYTDRPQRDGRPFPVAASSHAPYESDEESPPSPPPSPPRVNGSTPEKALESMDTKSPFRSPPRDPSCLGSESKSTMGFRSSPFFHRSPGITTSFDMGTPNGTLMADDDNLGPIFEAFNSTPSVFRGSFDAGMMGNLDDTPSPTAVGRDRPQQRSPITHHMSDLSSIDPPPLNGNITSYPHHEFDQQFSSGGRYHRDVHAESSSSASGRKYPKPSAVTVSDNRAGAPSSRLDPGAQPKQLWPPSESASKERSSSKSGTPARVRLEIGGTGSLSTRKTFEGINSMMQSRASTNHSKSSSERKSVTPGYLSTPGRSEGPGQHPRPSHPSYAMGDITTPRKAYSQIRSSHVRHQYSYPTLAGSGRKSMYPSKPDPHYPMGGAHKPIYMGLPHSREGNPTSHQSVPPPDGKENKKKGAAKKSSCNCKKSRCLKLYCECFAAERFCQGCNCSDCGNTPENSEERDKAIKDTRAKNSTAFVNRFSVENPQGAKATQKVHNMGCKCKKSACLKKYCECFCAGALCGAKCKCSDCLNYAGSQALIDKRRKIKDRPGAEYAARVSDEQWKLGSGRKAPPHRRHPMPSPVIMPPHRTMYPSPHGHPSQRGYSHVPPQRQYYMGPPTQMIPGHPHTAYPPINMAVTPGYHRSTHRMTPGEGPAHNMYRPTHSSRISSASKPSGASATKGPHKTTSGSPKTPGVRKAFDLATSRKGEPTESLFGTTNAKQPKTTALAVFSFLSNDDLYHASLVCRRWGELAFDNELWKF